MDDKKRGSQRHVVKSSEAEAGGEESKGKGEKMR
jgi:hypothetical protein